MLFRFCLYGFLKNQRYFEPFFMLALLAHDLNFFWIGMLYASRSLTFNLLEIPSGALADGWGRRRCMILSFAAYILSFLLFALAPHPLWLLPAMMLYAVGDSFRTGTHKAMIFQWLRIQGREDERTRIYGLTRGWSKFGSASSSVVAAILVLTSGDFRSVFLFATIPYVVNIINFLGYPSELDGLPNRTHSQRVNVAQLVTQTVETLKLAWRNRALRRLTQESMAWGGIFEAIQDYLQPVLIAVVVTGALANWDRLPASLDLTATANAVPENPVAVILISVSYAVLFLLSGWASRNAYRLVVRSGSEREASRLLWNINVALYVALCVCDQAGWLVIVALAFVLLSLLQNVWRPILISRFDQHADASRGATILSIESQARRLTSMLVAPLIGLAIDWISSSNTVGQFWPIGVAGAIASLIIIATSDRSPSAADSWGAIV